MMAQRYPLLPYVDFRSTEPPRLPIRQASDAGDSQFIARASVQEKQKDGIILTGVTQTGEILEIRVNIVAPGTVRVLLQKEADPNRITLARSEVKHAVAVTPEISEGRVILNSDQVAVKINLDPFCMTYCGQDGCTTLEQNYSTIYASGESAILPFGYSRIRGEVAAFHDTFTAEPDEHFYGFGEKFTDFDKRGQWLEMWQYNAMGVNTERAYKNVPFFLSTRGYGIFVDSITAARFDMAAASLATFSLIVPDSALDYYVILGPELKTIISRYAQLVSYPILPPKWAFGLWVSSGFKRDHADEVMKNALKIRDQQIPCDVFHLDSYWQCKKRWSDLNWDDEMYPDPERFVRQLKGQGFKVSLWINPYLIIGSARFLEAQEAGFLLNSVQGETYKYRVWAAAETPPVGIIDFTHPEAVNWFKELLRPLLQMGIDVIKSDFGEGVPVDAVAYNGLTGERLHNLYPLLYNDIVADLTSKEKGRPGLVWARSTYAGGQRHTAQWAGDPLCTYQAMASTLRGGLSIGMCGHAFWSHDIGGFRGQPTPDLYIRWAQFGLLSPLSRLHGTTTRWPWDYGEETLRIFRNYTRLRYRLLPYIYTYAAIATETSLPIMRPMVLEFPDDPNTYSMDLQYMLGSEILVAPIYNPQGRRSVYLPAGQWVDFWTNEVITGPVTRWIDAPLDIMPLYIRANALIPTIAPPTLLTETPFDLVTFDAYLFNQGHFTLHDTDGITQIKASLGKTRLDIEVRGVKKNLGLRLKPLSPASSITTVYLNERALERVTQIEIVPGAASGWAPDPNDTVYVMLSL